MPYDYVRRLRDGDADLRELLIYRSSKVPFKVSRDDKAGHCCAAAQVCRGVNFQARHKTRFVVLNSSARNPARRVLTAELRNRNPSILYDKEEYVKLLQRAFDGMFPRSIV